MGISGRFDRYFIRRWVPPWKNNLPVPDGEYPKRQEELSRSIDRRGREAPSIQTNVGFLSENRIDDANRLFQMCLNWVVL